MGTRAIAQADTANNNSLRDLLNVKVVTASKVSQGLEMAPATVTVVTREQIRSRGYQSLLDVMYDLVDAKVDDKMYSGMRNSFTVRGTQGSEKFVILMDGVSISSPSGEAMPIMENYPVNLAEQIEVVYGPASALYGANAVSGVINIITKKTLKKDLNLEISSTGGSYGYTNNSLFLAKKLGEHSRLVISGQYSYDQGADYSRVYENDDHYNINAYSTGTVNSIYGPLTPTKRIRPKYEAPMEAWNVYAALQLNSFNFSVFRNSANVPTSFGNNTSNAIYNKEVFMEQSVTTAVASYKKSFNKLSSATSLIVSQYNLNPQSNYRNLYSSMEPAYKYSTNTMVKMEQQVDYKFRKKAHLSSGVAYENYNAVPQSGDLAGPVGKDDFLRGSYLGTSAYYRPEGLPAQFYIIRYYNIGSYVQVQYAPGKKIYLTLGTRYDFNSRYGSTFNPRLGLVYKSSSNTTVKLLFGKAYLAPLPSVTYAQWGTFVTADSGRTYRAPFLHLPNPNLSPVVSYNAEASISHKLGDNVFVTANAYYTFLKGLHEFSDDNTSTKLYNNMFNGIPVDYIEVFTNNNRQKNAGGSLQLNWKGSVNKFRFTSYASVSYVTGLVDKGMKEKNETEPDKELDFISPFMFRFGIDGRIGKFNFSPRLVAMGRQHIAGIADTTGGIQRRQTLPGYALLNISLRYNTGKQISVFMNVANALNQRYRSVGFNMDLNNNNTDLFHGQRQDPVRVTGGISFSF